MTDAVPPEAADLLQSEPLMAHLATCRDGRPHVAPLWYHYDDEREAVEVTTAGRKLANLRENPRAAVSVQKDVDGRAQWMVTLLGTATVVEDEAETRRAAARINGKYGADASDYPENALVRIDVGSATYQTYPE
ncbi:MAG: pyridoxamine 5'-phosphate oxidase family protein [Haloferacaceae archaeon]